MKAVAHRVRSERSESLAGTEGVTVRVSHQLDKMWGRGWREVMLKSCQRRDKKEKPQTPYYVVLGAQLSRESRNRAARHQSCPLKQQANNGVKPLVTAAGGRRLTRNPAPCPIFLMGRLTLGGSGRCAHVGVISLLREPWPRGSTVEQAWGGGQHQGEGLAVERWRVQSQSGEKCL